MKLAIPFVLGCVGLSFGLAQGAGAADHAYVVSYIEAAPSTRSDASDLFKRFAQASRKDAGSVRFEVLQRIGHPDQFVVVEEWADDKAREAHGTAAHTQLFRANLQPLLRAPYDERPHLTLTVGPVQKSGKGAVYVVTHVDVVPKAKDEGAAAVQELTAASRKGAGSLRFDALTQKSRPNHMTLVEVWKDRKAVLGHSAADETRNFRSKLGPLTGALFDERFYHAID